MVSAMVQTRTGSNILASMSGSAAVHGTDPRTISRLADCNIRSVPEGTVPFHQGDEAPEVFFLASGRVIGSDSSTGDRQLHMTLEEPQFFGELGVLGEMGRTASALALEESEVWLVAGEVFLDFVR